MLNKEYMYRNSLSKNKLGIDISHSQRAVGVNLVLSLEIRDQSPIACLLKHLAL